MRLSTAAIACTLLSTCSAFAPQQNMAFNRLSQLNAYELKAEPEGGDEIDAIDTMDGSRMKNMGITTDAKSDDGDVYTFWLTAEASGALVKKFRVQVEKDASKNANFPGFRKGQVPPYAQPQMTTFAVQEGIIKTCEAAVNAYGLKALSGSEGSVEVHEDIKDICKGYKVGTDVQFTATFMATIDPEKQAPEEPEEAEEINEEVEEIKEEESEEAKE
mmetsp:Transcript_4817/g.4588  ORF Transcript_4817/g.4588 Transcript_4817/m.4588 type:complete len:217 (-) Transcript_4817:14-664(-)